METGPRPARFPEGLISPGAYHILNLRVKQPEIRASQRDGTQLHMFEIRIRRFRDPAGTWTTYERDSFAACFETFCELRNQSIGDTRTQDTEKGIAEVVLWFGGYAHD
jgi:hypothetical protein